MLQSSSKVPQSYSRLFDRIGLVSLSVSLHQDTALWLLRESDRHT
jgi:hypothetical protein